MKALTILLALTGLPALSEDAPRPVRVEGQDPDDKETCHVDLLSLNVSNSTLRQACVADGIIVNRAPFELGDVRVRVSIYEKGVLFRTLPEKVITRLEPRKSRTFTMESPLLAGLPTITSRTRISYRIGGVERGFEFDGVDRRFGKLYKDKEKGTRFGLSGLFIVAGQYKKTGNKIAYTGDTVFLRLWVEDLDAKKRPSGQVQVTMRYDGKKIGTLKRSIRTSHWKLDARRMPSSDADPKIICYDTETGELLVGLCRLKEDSKAEQIGMDVQFKWSKKAWSWEAVEPPFVEAPRPPDPK